MATKINNEKNHLEINVEEFNSKLNEIEPIMENVVKTIKISGTDLQNLKDSGSGLLKIHQIIPKVQKDLQNISSKTDSNKMEYEKIKNDAENLNNEDKKVLAGEIEGRKTEMRMMEYEIKRINAETAYIEKKLNVGLQESEVGIYEGIEKLSEGMISQADGYKAYILAKILSEVKAPTLDTVRTALNELNMIATEKIKEISTSKQYNISTVKIEDQIKLAVENAYEQRKDEIRDEIRKNVTKLSELNEKLENKKSGTSINDIQDYQNAMKIIENTESDYFALNEELDVEFSEIHSALSMIMNSYIHIIQKEPTNNIKKQEIINSLEDFKEKLTEIKMRVKEKKARDAAALGQLSRFIQDIVIKSEGQKTSTDLVTKVRNAREKLETKSVKSEDFYDKRISQIDQKIDSMLNLIKLYFFSLDDFNKKGH